MNDRTFTLPRLYTPDQSFDSGAEITLAADQAHYLRNVIRVKAGQDIRLFNGKDGEWLAEINNIDKKGAHVGLKKHLKEQPKAEGSIHLIFAPIKKQRMDMLIEKATELGVTDFHPIITHHTEVRDIKTHRIEAQIVEAAEQCERFTIPVLHDIAPMPNVLSAWPEELQITACLERHDAPHIGQLQFDKDKAFLIGPEGGFSAQEKEMLATHKGVQPVSLGDTVLRVETAAMYCLIQTHGK